MGTRLHPLLIAHLPASNHGPILLLPHRDLAVAPAATAARGLDAFILNVPDPSGAGHTILVSRESHFFSGRHRYTYVVPGVGGSFQWQNKGRLLMWFRSDSTQELLAFAHREVLLSPSRIWTLRFTGSATANTMGYAWALATLLSYVCVKSDIRKEVDNSLYYGTASSVGASMAWQTY